MKACSRFIIIALSALALAAGSFSYARAQGTSKPKATLNAEVATCFPDQTTSAITPAIMRQCVLDFIASWQQSAAVNPQAGTSYTIAASDYGQLVTFNNASPVAVTIPQASGSFALFNVFVRNLGAGTVTITPVAGTIDGSGSLALAQGSSTWIVSDGTNWQRWATTTTSTAITIGTSAVVSGITNQLLYDNGGVLGEITKCNNGAYITSGAGVPSCSSTLPSAVQANITGTGTLISGATGAGFTIALGTSTITGTLGVVNGGTGIALGTSGGVLYFSGSTTIASSAAGAANALMTWGGAGNAPNAVAITGLVLGNGAIAPSAYAGTSCTNQFPRSLNANGVATCATVANTDLANSSITVTIGATTDTPRFTGLGLGGAAPATGLQVYNAAVAPTGNGQGMLGATAAGGAIVEGQGSSFDISLRNRNGSDVCNAATGTTTLNCSSISIASTIIGIGANPTALVGLTAVNGVSANYIRADGAPALDQSIAPSWTGKHIWNVTSTVTSASGAALDDVKVQASTTTVTGTVTITKLAKVGLYQPTLTDASVVVVTDAATFYVDNSPLAAGSLTITNPWSILVNAGASKFQAVTVGGLATLQSNLKLPNAGVIYPATDSTTALAIAQSDGATRFVTFDSLNKRVGINKTPGAFDLEVNGTIAFGTLDATSLGLSTSTVTGLTANNSPNATNDFIPYYSAADGRIRKATVGSIAAGATAGVASINGATGALTLSQGTGISVSTVSTTITVALANIANLTMLANTSGSTTTPSAVNLATAGASWVLIDTKTASSSATLDFTTGIGSTYDSYMFEIVALLPATNAVDLWIRISEDGGSTFKSGATDYKYATGLFLDSATTANVGSTGDSKIRFTAGIMSSTAARAITGTVRFYLPSSTTVNKNFRADIDMNSDASGFIRIAASGVYVTDANAINAVRFMYSSGNIASGVIYLYGLRKS